MDVPPSPTQQATAAYPEGIDIVRSSDTSSASSESDNNASDSAPATRRSRPHRPSLPNRPESSSIIISKDKEIFQTSRAPYDADDARAMSPRRNSQDLKRLSAGARQSLKDQARTLQSSLQALAERIDEVRADHDKLESENKFLQDYIGGLTRTMTMNQRDLGTSSSGKSSGKGKASKAKR